MSYEPAKANYLCFAAAREDFLAGRDDSRAYLERCLSKVDELEPKVRAFAFIDAESARRVADASAVRYKNGSPLSAVDGLPIGIKDCYDAVGFPPEGNSALFTGFR